MTIVIVIVIIDHIVVTIIVIYGIYMAIVHDDIPMTIWPNRSHIVTMVWHIIYLSHGISMWQ